jgi:hypothetical protein
MKKVFFYLRQRKLLSCLLLSIFLLIVSFKTISNKLYFSLNQGWDYQSYELAEMINSVIGLPYYQKPQYKNDSTDIVRLSKDEWLALPYYDRHLKVTAVQDILNLVGSMPTKEEVEHIESIALHPTWHGARPNKAIYHKLCGYFLTCESLNISVQEYVLQKPELLQNIIKIAERPCDYIRTIDEVKADDKIVFSTNFDGVFLPKIYSKDAIEYGIKLARYHFDCDKKNWFTFPYSFLHSINSRKLVLLVINEDGIVCNKAEKSLDIIIERKDID